MASHSPEATFTARGRYPNGPHSPKERSTCKAADTTSTCVFCISAPGPDRPRNVLLYLSTLHGAVNADVCNK